MAEVTEVADLAVEAMAAASAEDTMVHAPGDLVPGLTVRPIITGPTWAAGMAPDGAAMAAEAVDAWAAWW